MSWFDESRLDDESVLATADLRLRGLAESGARVRREVGLATEAIAHAVARRVDAGRPRAVIAAGPDSRLLRAVIEPSSPVPFVAWPYANLPGWTGSLDLVIVIAPDGSDVATAAAVAEAVRRGCQLVVTCPANSLVAEHAGGSDSTIVECASTDQLAHAVVMLTFLDRVGLSPHTDGEAVAEALDAVAGECSPHRDLSVNPAKALAIALGDDTPVLWGGSVLAARAARRVAESLRRASGRTAIAGDAEQLLPLLETTRGRDIFDDPFDSADEARPVLVILDDGATESLVTEQRRTLVSAADERGIRVEVVSSEASGDVARYAALLLSGTYAADYLRLGLVSD